MRRLILPLLIAACLATLLGLSFGAALFQGEQFAFRDATHFYYPLYQRVQAEWNQGRWPLWEPEENGGMPLLGNPTAAVLYPGKILYAVLPYPWAARLYVVVHTALAFVAMFVLLRTWQISRTGSAIGALSYAFSAPILFQYCNIIYLVGAAWLPLGFRAVDGWLRRGRRGALLELAAVLALQTLGGEPQSAYLLGICAGGYALGLAWQRGLPPGTVIRLWTWKTALGVGLALLFWVSATLFMAVWAPTQRLHAHPPRPLPWMDWVHRADLIFWGLIGSWVVLRRLRRGAEDRLGTMLFGLGGAAILAAALAAAQLFPVLEFTSRSLRAADGGGNDIFPFSLEVQRLVDFLWPNFYGDSFTHNRSWYMLVPPTTMHATMWVPSLYLGGLTLLLALGSLGLRGGPPWRAWLTVIAGFTLVASLGEFSSPLWWIRFLPGMEEWVGPHDPRMSSTLRLDFFLRDGDGGVYWFLAVFLPGFRQFRFASKLLTFTTLALTALAGYGWDRIVAGRNRRTFKLAVGLLALTVVVLTLAVVFRSWIIARFEIGTGTEVSTPFGPIDARGSYNEVCWALGQGMVVLAITALLARYAWRRPELAGILALIAVTADLGVANTHYVLTLPQSLMETKPKVVEIIEDAERKDPAGQPFRVHRMPLWNPTHWLQTPSEDRVRDFVIWERKTIQPKYGINYGINYTSTEGTTELYDLKWFFAPFTRKARPDVASKLGVKLGTEVVYYPRRGYDLWNSRYFVVPAYPGGWTDELRGFAAFLERTELIYPPRELFQGPNENEKRERWLLEDDYQVYRNKLAYPRAWVVHQHHFHTPVEELDRWERTGTFQDMLYANDWLWKDETRTIYNLRTTAWIDANERSETLQSHFPGTLPQPGESATITHYSPQRVELDAVLKQPGLVILADVYYPGWKLTIDGQPASIVRANFLMRGAAVTAGKHHLVYTYEPTSFYVGLWVSPGALIAFGLLGVYFWRRPFIPAWAESHSDGRTLPT